MTSRCEEDGLEEEPLAQLPLRMRHTAIIGGSGRAGDGHERLNAQLAEGQLHSRDRLALLEWSSLWQVPQELSHAGSMNVPRWHLVRLGECIPAEAGAAPVHLSRLGMSPQWRQFLDDGCQDPRSRLGLDELLKCPCCFNIFRQPVTLPCGHSLCRSCYVRISVQQGTLRRCPLCRSDLPHGDLQTNFVLESVCDSLHAFRSSHKAVHG